jgi:hypothetical protein
MNMKIVITIYLTVTMNGQVVQNTQNSAFFISDTEVCFEEAQKFADESVAKINEYLQYDGVKVVKYSYDSGC